MPYTKYQGTQKNLTQDSTVTTETWIGTRDEMETMAATAVSTNRKPHASIRIPATSGVAKSPQPQSRAALPKPAGRSISPSPFAAAVSPSRSKKPRSTAPSGTIISSRKKAAHPSPHGGTLPAPQQTPIRKSTAGVNPSATSPATDGLFSDPPQSPA